MLRDKNLSAKGYLSFYRMKFFYRPKDIYS